ncbi:acyloxyacyl hydrolase [Pseudomonas amygdali]|uniref:acyloxyacyl hydrolase n=1 Tax=Pseudomonas amygdali TaxID=47877 RepID=UPI001CD8E287|nr:acyloxyacyl hydrolase [Pseudomonas amygdali]UBT80447.1 acyloxyacyl hydrolase [Pseudomonas amygdali]
MTTISLPFRNRRSGRLNTKSRRKLLVAGLLAVAAWVSAPRVQALDWQAFAGTGNRHSVNKAGVALVWDPHDALWQGETWQLRLRHELQLARWDVPHARDIYEFGYSPVLRLQRDTGGPWRPFIEASIGVRALSHTRLSQATTMSTAFQFSDTIGAGVRFGNRGRSTIGVRFQHLSNARIKRPNPGINFNQAYYEQSF